MPGSVVSPSARRHGGHGPVSDPRASRRLRGEALSDTIEVNRERTLRTILAFMLTLELGLVLLDFTVNRRAWVESDPVENLFNMAREDSASAWLSSAQALAVAAVLWMLVAHARGVRPARSPLWAWVGVAAFFTYLAIDDGASIHERVGTTFEEWNGGRLTDRFPSYPWQLVYGPVFAAFGLLTVSTVRTDLERRWQTLFFAGLTLYVAAVAIDYAEGIPDVFTGSVRHYTKVFEEFIEMFGTTLILVALLGHLMTRAPHLAFRFT